MNIPDELWNAAPKDARWWAGAMPDPGIDYNDDNECPGHGYVTEDGGGDLAFCDGSCVDEEAHARTMASLLGVDLNDRYPKADPDGIIRTTSFDRD